MVIRLRRCATINANAFRCFGKFLIAHRFGNNTHGFLPMTLTGERTLGTGFRVCLTEKHAAALRTDASRKRRPVSPVLPFFNGFHHAALRLYMPSYVTGDLLTITAACVGRGVLSPSLHDKTVRGLTPKSFAAFWSSFIFSRYSIKSILPFYTFRVRPASTFLHVSLIA